MAGPSQLRFPHLEGMRGIAAVLVVVAHVGFWTGSSMRGPLGGLQARGDVGVAVFFALSGFLLGLPRVGSTVATGTYLQRRAARILPAYFLALLAVLVSAALAGEHLGVARVASNLLVVQGLTGDLFVSFSQTWSLTTELTFYLVLPVVGLALARRGPGSTYRLLALTAVVGLAATAVAATSSSAPARALGLSAVGHAAWFAVGLATAVALATEPATPPVWWRLARSAPDTLVTTAALLLLVASTGLAGPRDLSAAGAGQAVVKEILYAAVAACLLLACLSRDAAGSRFAQVMDSAATRGLGRVSYGIFLWHVLVLQLLFLWTGWSLFRAPFWPVLLVVLVVSTGLAAASYWCLEQPVRRVTRRRQERARHQQQHAEQEEQLAGPRAPVAHRDRAEQHQQRSADHDRETRHR